MLSKTRIILLYLPTPQMIDISKSQAKKKKKTDKEKMTSTYWAEAMLTRVIEIVQLI